MRTGNVVLDMMIAMSIPLALQGLFKFWEWLRPRIEDFLFSLRQKDDYFVRSIEYEKVCSVAALDSVDLIICSILVLLGSTCNEYRC